MTRFVLDASVALRWFLDHPVPAYANRVKQLLFTGARAVVPALWHLEMANGLRVAERRGILTVADVDRSLTDIEQLLGESVDSDTALISARQALNSARPFGLSAYDAVYLDLARREQLPLATLDGGLRAATSQAGVRLLR